MSFELRRSQTAVVESTEPALQVAAVFSEVLDHDEVGRYPRIQQATVQCYFRVEKDTPFSDHGRLRVGRFELRQRNLRLSTWERHPEDWEVSK